MLFCVRAVASPADVARRYMATLAEIYTGDPFVVELSQLRPVVSLLMGHAGGVDIVSAAIAAALLTAAVWLAFRDTASGPLGYAAPGLVGLWSLLTFFHLTYGFVLLVPLAVALVIDDNPRTAVLRTRLFWLLQLGLMVDVPGVWRRLDTLWALPTALGGVAAHADRALMLTLFCGVAWLAAQPPSRAAPGR